VLKISGAYLGFSKLTKFGVVPGFRVHRLDCGKLVDPSTFRFWGASMHDK